MDGLLPLVYDELRALASSYLRGERAGHTMQTSDLVHEAFLRLMGAEVTLHDRTHFLAIAARTMRRVLVDHARRHDAGKRVGWRDKAPLNSSLALAVEPQWEILAVDQALEQLGRIHPRQAQLVELRYFGGLTAGEISEILEISIPTVDRDWRVARLWLRDSLAG